MSILVMSRLIPQMLRNLSQRRRGQKNLVSKWVTDEEEEKWGMKCRGDSMKDGDLEAGDLRLLLFGLSGVTNCSLNGGAGQD